MPPEPSISHSTAGTTERVAPAPGRPRLLAFTRTEGFRHQSIAAAIDGIEARAAALGYGLSVTEDPHEFTDELLSQYAAVLFVSTTGDVLDASAQAAFERYIGAGGGFVGVHAAADCEYDWPWYGGLVGAYFAGHGEIAEANVRLEPVSHPALAELPSPWQRRDEWYGFRQNPRGAVTVLLTVDEASFDAGAGSMGADHPVSWFHEYQGGRAFYTALGHTPESYADPVFMGHLWGGIAWAAADAQ